jgi:hypothetical protein
VEKVAVVKTVIHALSGSRLLHRAILHKPRRFHGGACFPTFLTHVFAGDASLAREAIVNAS